MALQIISLARLCEIPDDSPMATIVRQVSELGLTDAVRFVLQASDIALTTIQVRDQLIRVGCDLSQYQNSLAAINTVLGRFPADLVESTVDEETGKTLYQWNPPQSGNEIDATWDRVATLPAKEVRRIAAEVGKGMIGTEPKPKKRTARKK
jgi:hypothetical protein